MAPKRKAASDDTSNIGNNAVGHKGTMVNRSKTKPKSRVCAATKSPQSVSSSSNNATTNGTIVGEPSSIVNAYTNVEDDEAALRAALGCGNPIITESENLIVQLNVEPASHTNPVNNGNRHLAYPSNHMPYTPNNTFQSFPAVVGTVGTVSNTGNHHHHHNHHHTFPPSGTSATSPIPVDSSVIHPGGSAYMERSMSCRVVELLKDFEMKSRASEWPSSTSICCYWCCHTFKNPPFGIPVKYMEGTSSDIGTFHVFGCFCSLECAAAYNFDASADSIDEKWERYSLINFLSRSLDARADSAVGDSPADQSHTKVKLAPNRLALEMFGGHMTIDEFRSSAASSKIVNINFPPMATLTQQVEELNDSDVRSEYRYIPLDIDRINRYKEKIILKRSKPTTASKKNTLDSLMNLRFTAN